MGDVFHAKTLERVRAAFAAGDLNRFAALLHPEARWVSVERDEESACSNRDQVLAVMRPAFEAGVRATLVQARLSGDRVLVELQTHVPPEVADTFPLAARPGAKWKVLTLSAGTVTHIQDCSDRDEAEALLLPA